MAETITIPDLENGKVDIDTLADIVNLQEPTTETRLSGPVNTWFGVQSQLSSATGLAYTSKTLMDAAPGTKVGQAARVTEGADAGLYLWSGSAWVKTDDPINKGPLLTSSGANYPLKPMVRNGSTSLANNTLNGFLLDFKLINTDSAYYYRWHYFANGAGSFAGGPDAISVYKYKKDTYATAAVSEQVISTSAVVEPFVRDGTVQTRLVRGNIDTNVIAMITIDTSKLPAYGTAINTESVGAGAYSWIIDPSLYFPKTAKDYEGPLLSASGIDFPLKKMTRDGVTSGASAIANGFMVDIKVIGADPDYYYRWHYLANGAGPFAGGPDAMSFYRFKKDTYATASVQEQMVSTAVVVEPFVRDGTVQTRLIPSPVDPGLSFIVSVDTSKLPAYGTAVNLNGSTASAGYSWIIDPSLYFPKTVSATPPVGSKTMNYDYTASLKLIRFSYQSKDRLYRVGVGLSTYNNLPNIRTVEAANYAIAPVYSTLITTTGDWFAPLRLKATTGVNEAAPRLTAVGGNHGRGGAANGYRTAKSLVFNVTVDGVALDMSQDSSGPCDEVGLEIVNAIRASNTVDSQPITHGGNTITFTGDESDPVWLDEYVEPPSEIRRYVVHQCFNVNCSPFGMAVECRLVPLEPVLIFSDHSLQSFTGGFNGSIMFADGQYSSRQSFATGLSSGDSDDYPDAWAVIFKGTGGLHASWIDATYGQGDGSMVHPTHPRILMGVGSNTKCYQAVMKSPFVGGTYDYENGGMELPADYKWRGGYIWSADTGTAEFDSVLSLAMGRDRKFAYVNPDSTSIRF